MNASRVSMPIAVAVSAALLLIGAAGGYWLSLRGAPAATGGAAGRQVLYWHDPMVPNARFDKPGKSPFMDMPLVPVYADEANDAPGVRVASNVTQSLGVRTSVVRRTVLVPRIRVVGAVAFNDQLLEVVSARTEGVITRLYVQAPLQEVKRGQPLAEVMSPAWREAQQEFLSLLEAKSAAGRELRAAARERLGVLGIPETAIQAIEARRAVAATVRLVAPVDGVISELGVRDGSAVSPGMSLFRINGLASVWMNARIPEAQRALVAVGSQVEATTVAWPGVRFQGRVIALQPQVEPDSRTITARILLANGDRRLAPGMFASADIAAPARAPQLIVPDEAVITTGARTVVIATDGTGQFRVAPVIVGDAQDGNTVVMEGLEEGQRVVVSGQFLIDSEASLRSAVDRLEAPSVAPAAPAARPTSVSHAAEGTITAITADAITIAHGPVPALAWPAMTMSFATPEQELRRALRVGDRISFSFAESGGGYRLVRVKRLDERSDAVQVRP